MDGETTLDLSSLLDNHNADLDTTYNAGHQAADARDEKQAQNTVTFTIAHPPTPDNPNASSHAFDEDASDLPTRFDGPASLPPPHPHGPASPEPDTTHAAHNNNDDTRREHISVPPGGLVPSAAHSSSLDPSKEAHVDVDTSPDVAPNAAERLAANVETKDTNDQDEMERKECRALGYVYFACGDGDEAVERRDSIVAVDGEVGRLAECLVPMWG